jgi:hypothetical protein
VEEDNRHQLFFPVGLYVHYNYIQPQGIPKLPNYIQQGELSKQ